MRSMVWFRRDLRTHDNPALFHACQYGDEGVLAVYIIDEEMWRKNDNSQRQIEFILAGLTPLRTKLEVLGVPLIVKRAQTTLSISSLLSDLIEQHQITKVFWNRENEFNELSRDQKVEDVFQRQAISFETFCDQMILDTPSVHTASGHFFQVFTPFRRKWQAVLREQGCQTLPVPKRVSQPLSIKKNDLPERPPGVGTLSEWRAGEEAALERLDDFCSEAIFTYDQTRDSPSLNGTSRLSPWLATGMLSPRVCFQRALLANQGEMDSGSRGAVVFMTELIWREFYRHIVVHVPSVCKRRPFRLETEKWVWEQNSAHLTAWQTGQTGFPLVDAGMRQLNETGWMHNRLRMVTAMFLSKNLLLDWRCGEKYFAENLIDFDFASNNGGWQWSASTGTDAVPWFRLFNPVLQSQRFDPNGTFIRQFCPELESFNDKDIHHPWHYCPILAAKAGYAKLIVDLKASRQRALAAFSRLKGK